MLIETAPASMAANASRTSTSCSALKSQRRRRTAGEAAISARMLGRCCRIGTSEVPAAPTAAGPGPFFAGAAGTIAFFASSPLLGCQICGYGCLAGGGLNTLIGLHDTVRGPQSQCMPDVRGRIQTTAALSEGGMGLVGLGIVGELGAASSTILPIAVGGVITCAALTIGQACCAE